MSNGLLHRNSGQMVKEDGVSTGNIVDILEDIDANIIAGFNGDTINPGSLIGTLTIDDITPVELKVGASILAGRNSVFLFNDSSFLVYVGFSSGMTSADGILINSGNNAQFEVDPTGTMTFYALTFEGTAVVKIMEVK